MKIMIAKDDVTDDGFSVWERVSGALVYRGFLEPDENGNIVGDIDIPSHKPGAPSPWSVKMLLNALDSRRLANAFELLDLLDGQIPGDTSLIDRVREDLAELSLLMDQAGGALSAE